jgi:RNA binding exosome subunit
MASFDFIIGEDFRGSLERDYDELNLAMQAKIWKAAYVLAGSIIEAILIDYLIASGYQRRPHSDILKMDLAQAITACREENVLSEKTEHLSHAIRSYRNLIHPGRSIRLGETANENGAKIAQALVEIIIEEIAERKKQNYGNTAEQIVTKLENDSTALAILSHLLEETNEHEKERLLLNVIPRRYLNYYYLLDTNDKAQELLKSLVVCYRLSFNTISDNTKKKIVKQFVRTIKEESSDVTWRYAFFRGGDLQYLPPEEASLIKQHLLSILEAPLTRGLLQATEGIGGFLTPEEAEAFVYPFINSVAGYDKTYVGDELFPTRDVIQRFAQEFLVMGIDECQTVINLLKELYHSNKSQGRLKLAEAEKRLYETIWPDNDLDQETIPEIDDLP